ncbi:MAG TPA: hypothetical protein VHR42_10515 [Clostridia bacterium]|nr:hypothetical protein [Clostridia bacterium]
MKTKIVSLVLALTLMFTFSVPAFAKTASGPSGDIHIMLINTDDATSMVSFNGDCADCSAIIHAKTGTTKIAMTGVLKRVTDNGTTTVKSWTKTVNGETLTFDKNWYVASGYDYEFEVLAKVYRNGTMEAISVTDSAHCG